MQAGAKVSPQQDAERGRAKDMQLYGYGGSPPPGLLAAADSRPANSRRKEWPAPGRLLTASTAIVALDFWRN